MKGKIAKQHPPVITTKDCMELPDESDVKGWLEDLTINVLYINDCSFFHSIDRKIKFWAVVPLGRGKRTKALKHVLHFYNVAE